MREFVAGALALVLCGLAMPAQAQNAQCFTTDDGYYPCTFEGVQGNGSFIITGKGKPTFSVMITSPGVAEAFGVFERGGRSVLLPGPYYRSQQDGACWISSATDTQICAW